MYNHQGFLFVHSFNQSRIRIHVQVLWYIYSGNICNRIHKPSYFISCLWRLKPKRSRRGERRRTRWQWEHLPSLQWLSCVRTWISCRVQWTSDLWNRDSNTLWFGPSCLRLRALQFHVIDREQKLVIHVLVFRHWTWVRKTGHCWGRANLLVQGNERNKPGLFRYARCFFYCLILLAGSEF